MEGLKRAVAWGDHVCQVVGTRKEAGVVGGDQTIEQLRSHILRVGSDSPLRKRTLASVWNKMKELEHPGDPQELE